jgi:excisionase family DNA binding protein
MESHDPLMTTDEVAAYSRLSVATIRWLRHANRGPVASTLGRRVLYRQSDVDAWIAASRDKQPAA